MYESDDYDDADTEEERFVSLDDLEEESDSLDYSSDWDDIYDDMDSEYWDERYHEHADVLEKDPWELN